MVVTGLHKAMKWHLEIQERLILASISRSVSPSLHSDPQAGPDQAGLRLPAPAAAEIRPSSGHLAGPDLIRRTARHSRTHMDTVGPCQAKSNSPRVRENPAHGLFPQVVAGVG